MCAGLALFRDMNEVKVFFPNPSARILCRTRSGNMIDAVWGRRNEKENPETGFPVTGWARLESIQALKWDRFHGEKVHIPATSYMEKDSAKKSHWFQLEMEQFLVGVLLRWQDLHFVYVVTIPTPETYRHIHDRWVLINQLKGIDKSTL